MKLYRKDKNTGEWVVVDNLEAYLRELGIDDDTKNLLEKKKHIDFANNRITTSPNLAAEWLNDDILRNSKSKQDPRKEAARINAVKVITSLQEALKDKESIMLVDDINDLTRSLEIMFDYDARLENYNEGKRIIQGIVKQINSSNASDQEKIQFLAQKLIPLYRSLVLSDQTDPVPAFISKIETILKYHLHLKLPGAYKIKSKKQQFTLASILRDGMTGKNTKIITPKFCAIAGLDYKTYTNQMGNPDEEKKAELMQSLDKAHYDEIRNFDQLTKILLHDIGNCGTKRTEELENIKNVVQDLAKLTYTEEAAKIRFLLIKLIPAYRAIIRSWGGENSRLAASIRDFVSSEFHLNLPPTLSKGQHLSFASILHDARANPPGLITKEFCGMLNVSFDPYTAKFEDNDTDSLREKLDLQLHAYYTHRQGENKNTYGTKIHQFFTEKVHGVQYLSEAKLNAAVDLKKAIELMKEIADLQLEAKQTNLSQKETDKIDKKLKKLNNELKPINHKLANEQDTLLDSRLGDIVRSYANKGILPDSLENAIANENKPKEKGYKRI